MILLRFLSGLAEGSPLPATHASKIHRAVKQGVAETWGSRVSSLAKPCQKPRLLLEHAATGSLYLGHVYLARLSATDARTKIFGYWELGTAAGLVSGPALASFLATGPWAQVLPGPGEAMAVCIAMLACCLMVAILLFFPSTSELCEDGAVGARPLSGAALTDRAWTVQLTLSGSTDLSRGAASSVESERGRDGGTET
eukprot:s9819_g1.t1